MELLMLDVRFAVRSLRKNLGFTAVAVVTIALGIGATTAIFSVTNTVLLRPLPYRSPEELVLVWNRLENANLARTLVSGPDFLDYRNETTMFEGFAGAFAIDGTITGDGRAEQIMVGWSTGNLFKVLGVTPILGRDFNAEDGTPIDPQVFLDPNATIPPGALILSHGLWQRRFGSDPNVLGRSIQVDGQPSFIVGVLPADFRIYLPIDAGMPTNVDMWRVIPIDFSTNPRDAEWLTVVARLKKGVTVERAQAEMDALAQRLREQYQHNANEGMRIVLNSMHRDVVEHARPVLMALLGAVGFVLLIACANVANLLLVRATSREREIAVRAAMGGDRGRIVRQLLTESVVLAVCGAAVGLVLAWAGIQILVAMSPGNLPRVENVVIDGTVLLFAAVATVVAALVFGTAPALKATSPNLVGALKERGSDAGGVRGNKLRTALVVSEVALSLVLLIGAGLMLRSFAKLQQVEPGFDPENVLTLSVPLPLFGYRDPNQRADFFVRLRQRVEALPGVADVGGVSPLPLSGGDQYLVGSYGRVGVSEEEWTSNKADYRAVLPGYYKAMRTQVVAGRTLTEADNQEGSPYVVVVDRKLSERTWPDDDPIGRQLQIERFDVEGFDIERVTAQVVGVVEPVNSQTLAAAGRETIYFPYRFFPWWPVSLTVRATANPTALINLIRNEVEAMDPEVPIANVRLMEEYVSDAMAQTRFTLTLTVVFAVLALVLASIGLYGVISYSVRQRTQEIGVRMAFGAQEGNIVRLVLKQGLALALGGVGVGLVAAFLLTRMVSSLLFGVTATDPVTFLGIPLLLIGVASIASYLPARRAMRVDPVRALQGK